MSFITHYELGLENEDFDFEILKKGKDFYPNYDPFRIRQICKVRVNDDRFDLNTSIIDVEDFLKGWNYSKETIKKAKLNQMEDIKFNAILKYVNRNQFQRKLKLEKIMKLNGD